MTICIAMYCIDSETNKPALLVATDNQFTRGNLTSSGDKIYGFEVEGLDGVPGFVFAICGDIYVADEAVHKIQSLIENNMTDDNTVVEFLLTNKERIGDIVFDVYSKHKNRTSIEPASLTRALDPTFEILIGAADDNYAEIVHIMYNGKVYTCPGFAIIGHGMLTGGLLLLNEYYRNDLNDLEAARLACQIITLVSNIDGTVNNSIDYLVVVGNKLQGYEQETLDTIEQMSQEFWELLVTSYWKLQKDDTFYPKLVKILNQ